jgi:hypothetical protein
LSPFGDRLGNQAAVRRHKPPEHSLLFGPQMQAKFGAAPEHILGGLGPFVPLQVTDLGGTEVGPKASPKILKPAGAVHYALKAGSVSARQSPGMRFIEKRPTRLRARDRRLDPLPGKIASKLDRLGRNMHYISGLMEHKVAFIVTALGLIDDAFMMHIYASVAEKERNLISQRTKEGVGQAKARGVKLGHPRHHEIAGAGVATLKARADQVAARVLPIIESIQARGITGAKAIGLELERLQVRTARGGTVWSASQVQNVLKRKQ